MEYFFLLSLSNESFSGEKICQTEEKNSLEKNSESVLVFSNNFAKPSSIGENNQIYLVIFPNNLKEEFFTRSNESKISGKLILNENNKSKISGKEPSVGENNQIYLVIFPNNLKEEFFTRSNESKISGKLILNENNESKISGKEPSIGENNQIYFVIFPNNLKEEFSTENNKSKISGKEPSIGENKIENNSQESQMFFHFFTLGFVEIESELIFCKILNFPNKEMIFIFEIRFVNSRDSLDYLKKFFFFAKKYNGKYKKILSFICLIFDFITIKIRFKKKSIDYVVPEFSDFFSKEGVL